MFWPHGRTPTLISFAMSPPSGRDGRLHARRSGDLDFVRHKDEVLRQWCERVGRNEAEIERTLGLGGVVIRDSEAEAKKVDAKFRDRHPGYDDPPKLGSADQLAESLAPYVELGFRHIFYDVPSPLDEETLERFVGEVKPKLEKAGATTAGRR
jgi:hypothetical protein